MLTIFSRIIKYGWTNFLRNGWLSVAAINIMLLTLIVFQGLIIFRVVTNYSILTLKDKIDISTYFKEDAPEDAILAIRDRIQANDKIKNVEYISKEKALELFKEKNKGKEFIVDALNELGSNPLHAYINIKSKDPKDYAEIALNIQKQKEWEPFVSKVTYEDNQLIINRLAKIVDTIQKFGFILTFFLAMTAILITFNTIGLVMYSSRDEISIMRLVGAKNSIIVGQYLVTSCIYSTIGAVLSMMIFYPFIVFTSPYVKFFLSTTDLLSYYKGNMIQLFFYQVVFGALLALISAKIASRKYLRV